MMPRTRRTVVRSLVTSFAIGSSALRWSPASSELAQQQVCKVRTFRYLCFAAWPLQTPSPTGQAPNPSDRAANLAVPRFPLRSKYADAPFRPVQECQTRNEAVAVKSLKHDQTAVTTTAPHRQSQILQRGQIYIITVHATPPRIFFPGIERCRGPVMAAITARNDSTHDLNQLTKHNQVLQSAVRRLCHGLVRASLGIVARLRIGRAIGHGSWLAAGRALS